MKKYLLTPSMLVLLLTIASLGSAIAMMNGVGAEYKPPVLTKQEMRYERAAQAICGKYAAWEADSQGNLTCLKHKY